MHRGYAVLISPYSPNGSQRSAERDEYQESRSLERVDIAPRCRQASTLEGNGSSMKDGSAIIYVMGGHNGSKQLKEVWQVNLRHNQTGQLVTESKKLTTCKEQPPS